MNMHHVTDDPTQKNCIVFLDLEETVIDTWDQQNLLLKNIDAIEAFLNGREIRIPPINGKGKEIVSPATPKLNLRVGLMSWAVWNDEDKAKFNKNLRPHLENLLKLTFDDELIWSMNDWAREVFKYSNKLVMKEDMFDLFGKPEVLFKLMPRHHEFKNTTVFLIDDAYEHHMHMRSYKNKCAVELWNINEMVK